MISTGLQKLVRFLFGTISSEEGRIQFLSARYPNASQPVIASGLSEVRAAQQAGAEFQLGPSHPDISSIPIDPDSTSPGRFAYRVNIEAYGYQGGQRTGRPAFLDEFYHVFYSDQPMSRSELMEMSLNWLLGLQEPGRFGLAPLEQADRIIRHDVQVLSITRRD